MRAFLRNKTVALPLSVLAAFLASCTAVEDDNTTNTIVTIVSLEGDLGAEVFSDVCILTAGGGCSVVNDNAQVVMIARGKDQIRDIGQFGDIVFERYRVTYIRADGRNVPGVEVPFPFDGAINFRVPITGISVTRGFMVVRQQAKLEPPLSNLPFLGGALVLSTITQIDFFGKDVAGRPITVTGFLNVSFADFPDP